MEHMDWTAFFFLHINTRAQQTRSCNVSIYIVVLHALTLSTQKAQNIYYEDFVNHGKQILLQLKRVFPKITQSTLGQNQTKQC